MALRLGKPGVVLGAAVDRAAARGLRPAPARTGPSEDALYRDLWTAAADAAGYRVTHADGAFVRVETTWLYHQETDLDGVATLHLAADKAAVHRLLTEAGVPVPPHVVFDAAQPQPGLDFLARHGRCVVKPAQGTARAAGVTTGVTTVADFDRAVLAAARWDRLILIEPQLVGDMRRLLYLDGELLDDVIRHPPRLAGDGATTVRALIEAENQRRALAESSLGTAPLTLDLDVALTLRAQGLSLRSTPTGPFAVKGVANDNAAADNVRPDSTPADIAERGARAAAAVGVRFAGVDVIGDVVLEVNGTPGLLLHQRAAGAPMPDPPPAVRVLRALLA